MPCHPHQFTRLSAVVPSTASALLGEIAGRVEVMRREAAHGIVPDNLLTAGTNGPAAGLPEGRPRRHQLTGGSGASAPRWIAALRRLRVERRAERQASSVMTEGCEAVTEAKQITVVAERKPVRAVSGSSCVVMRSGQVGTDASRGASGGAASCLAWRSAGRAQPSLFECSHDWCGL
jgi:hypothetical protein